MRVVSFYSYKGGTGRTLLLANVATYAARLGLTVAMVDLDLEAPGLAYKFLPSPPARPGIVEWFTATEQPSLLEMVEHLGVREPFNAGGALWLIGAGAPPSQGYLRHVRQLQSTVFADDSATAVAGMLDLRDALERELSPDLLLLDARTGISNTNAITTRVLADDVVALTLNTAEQREGTREVLRSLVPLTKPHNSQQSLGLHIVVSRIPDLRRGTGNTASTDRDARIAADIRKYLTAPAKPLTSTLMLTEAPLLLHEDAALADNEHLLLAQHTSLARSRRLRMDYLVVAERLLGPSVVSPAIAQAFDNISETQRLERGEFFVNVDQILKAKARPASAQIRPPPGQDRSALKRKVDVLRRAAGVDPARQPDLAAALVELAWATFDARTASKSNGLSFLRDAQRIYSELADRQPDGYSAAHLDSLIQYSAMAAQLGHLDEALNNAVSAVNVAVAGTADHVIPAILAGKALHNLAAIRHGAGQVSAALEAIRQATRIFDEELDPDRQPDPEFLLLRASAYNLRAITAAMAGKSKEALKSADTAVTAYRDLVHRDARLWPSGRAGLGLGRALSNRSNIYRATSQFRQAVNDAAEATSVLGDLSAEQPEIYLADLASTYQTLSLALTDLGEHAQALQAAEQAVHLWRDLLPAPTNERDLVGLIGALNTLATCYARTERFDDAIASAREAIEVTESVEHRGEARGTPDEALIRALRRATAPVWFNLAAFYRDIEDVERALFAAFEAQRAYAAAGPIDARTEFTLETFIAESCLDLDDAASAYDHARRAITLAEKTGEKAALASAHRLASRAKAREDPAAAIAHAEQAATLSVEAADLTGQVVSMQLLADAFSEAGQTRRAEAVRTAAQEIRTRALHTPGEL